MTSQIFTNKTTTGASTAVTPRRFGESNTSLTAVYGVSITGGTASVNLEGSFDGVIWFVIDTVTATTAKVFALFQFLRFNVTAIAGATVNAWIYE